MNYNIDRNGYARRTIDNRLVHRVVAYHQVYLPNRDLYPLPFSSYDIHHMNYDKLDNRPENLKPIIHDLHFGIYHSGSLDSKLGYYSR